MITVSIDTAKKLECIGREKECYFTWEMWIHAQLRTKWDREADILNEKIYWIKSPYRFIAQAPTAQELLDVFENIGIFIMIHYHLGNYDVSAHNEKFNKQVYENNLAEALAQLVIWCVENGYLILDEWNKDLDLNKTDEH